MRRTFWAEYGDSPEKKRIFLYSKTEAYRFFFVTCARFEKERCSSG